MQILHFDWLRYKGSNSNNSQGFSLVFFPLKIFLQLAFSNFIIAFYYSLLLPFIIALL